MNETRRTYRVWIVAPRTLDQDILASLLDVSCQVQIFSHGQAVLDALSSQQPMPDLLLLTLRMPEKDGIDVLVYMNRFSWIRSIPVILLCNDEDEHLLDRAFALGALDAVSWPLRTILFRRKVSNTLHLYERKQHLEQLVLEQTRQKNENDQTMIQILSHIVETRNGESGAHVTNVCKWTELLLKELSHRTLKYNLNSAQIAQISTAAALHDIGKIVIPEKILNKPGKLTQREFERIKTHSMEGARILEQSGLMETNSLVRTAYEICRWHHERIDGSGYPDGLVEDEIPISAQVVSIADVYDALTSERCYKKAIAPQKALEMIFAGDCGPFSPILLDCLRAVSGQFGAFLETGNLKPVQ